MKSVLGPQFERGSAGDVMETGSSGWPRPVRLRHGSAFHRRSAASAPRDASNIGRGYNAPTHPLPRAPRRIVSFTANFVMRIPHVDGPIRTSVVHRLVGRTGRLPTGLRGEA